MSQGVYKDDVVFVFNLITQKFIVMQLPPLKQNTVEYCIAIHIPYRYIILHHYLNKRYTLDEVFL